MSRKIAARLLVLLLTASLAAAKKKTRTSSANSQMSKENAAVQALNRLTFGPRPGDVERVRAIGVDQWIEQQLHPEHIDDGELAPRLAPLLTLKMDSRQLLENFPPPQVLKAIDEGKMALPSDPKKRAIYEAQLATYREHQRSKQDKAAEAVNGVPSQPRMSGMERPAAKMAGEEKAETLLDMPSNQRYQAFLRMSPEERRMVQRGLSAEDREHFMNELTPQQRETVMATSGNPQQVVALELQEGKLLRAIYSERQLEEVITDFWLNHFNVFLGKGADRYMVTSYERDVIRPHALGKFKDLLLSTAKSPAMLFYLDNWLSIGPHSQFALNIPKRNSNRARRQMRAGGPFGMPVYRPARPLHPSSPQQTKREGLNENYGRELMELHTLGVGGGYSQLDVTEVAKVFTGWTIKEPRQGGGFEFNQRTHEPGPKYVLGRTIKERGEKEGEEVLALLAHHPSTAPFVCRKLAIRFVSDDPPPALVDRMAETFRKKDGDIREVLRTLFHSTEFWAPDTYRAKVKTPLEFVVSALRATGAEVSNPLPLITVLNRMNMPPYGMQPPSGYSMKADAWVSSAALLNRMNFALALATGRLHGLHVDPARVLSSNMAPDANAMLVALESELLAGDVSPNTHATILRQLNDPRLTGRGFDDPQHPAGVGVIAGLLLGSPEFQRR